ncbi:hypothetical protein MSG28_008703 [Choristoneura fumiferana]|uniref:Uncharacterized protein n=1 Tax=Choristoneura fumiferana TaxID=7141 RepID=A0ACC0J7N5_CHOFU|nr:hypothetical protein MSG28_008703 [Choristoneura fumiferana]
MAGQDNTKPNQEKSDTGSEIITEESTDENIIQEYDMLDSKLDELNTALDFLEQKNDDIHQKLKELLQSNIDIRQQLQNENLASSNK